MDYEQIITNYQLAVNMPTTTSDRYLPNDSIFDENKSVKWNREQVEKYNNDIQNERNRLRQVRAKAIEKAYQDIMSYLKEEYPKISAKKIESLYDRVYNDIYEHDYRIKDVIDDCEEYLEIFSEED